MGKKSLWSNTKQVQIENFQDIPEMFCQQQKHTQKFQSISGRAGCNVTSLPDALNVLDASQVWINMNWKLYSLSYSFISLQVRTETCTATSQAVICFVTEKGILFSKIISWAPLQATEKKQNPIIQTTLLIKGIHKVEQEPDSSAMVSFEAGLGNLDLWEFDANSEHLFTVQHYLKQWGWAAEAALLQPCPQTMQCSFTTPQHQNSRPRPRQADVMWILCGNGRADVQSQWRSLLLLVNHTKLLGLTSTANVAILHLRYIPHPQHS